MLCWRVSNLYIRSFLLRPLAGLCICTHRIDMCGGGIKTSGTKMAPPSNCAANTAGAPKKLRVLSPYLQTTLHIQCLSGENTKIALWQPTVQQAEDSPSGSCTTSKWTGRGRTTCQSHLRSYKFWTTLLASPSQSDSPSCRCSWKTYSMMKMAMKNDASPSWLSLVTIHPKPKW